MEATNSNLTSPSKQNSRLSSNQKASENAEIPFQISIQKKYSEDLTLSTQMIPKRLSINSRLDQLKRKKFPSMTPLLTPHSIQFIPDSKTKQKTSQNLLMPSIPKTPFKKLCQLGKGFQAMGCYKCIDNRNNNTVVVKEIKNNDEEICSQFKAEFKFIKKFDHKNIIKALELITEIDSCQIVMEYAKGKPLDHYLTKLTDNQILSISQQIFSALTYLHSRNVMHRDLHFQNLIYDKNSANIKIIDFGLAKKFREKAFGTSCAGGMQYRAPEMLNFQPYTCKIDVLFCFIFFYFIFSVGKLD